MRSRPNYVSRSEEVEANLAKIEQMVNKTQSGFTDRKATITGSSFYERTM